LKPAPNSRSRNDGRVRSISHCASGCSRMIAIRPASESESFGSSSTLVEPVSTNRPGRRSRSIAAFSVTNNCGTCCTSSRITRGGRSATKPTGSVVATLRIASSSKLRYAYPARADALCERRLAALARTVDQHRRRIVERLGQPIGGKAGIRVRLGRRAIVNSGLG
jgi:hypothetical protein